MDQKIYHHILIKHAVSSWIHLISEDSIYQQGNDVKHTSKLCKNCLKKRILMESFKIWIGLHRVNLIEHLWDISNKNLDKSTIISQNILWK